MVSYCIFLASEHINLTGALAAAESFRDRIDAAAQVPAGEHQFILLPDSRGYACGIAPEVVQFVLPADPPLVPSLPAQVPSGLPWGASNDPNDP